MNYYFIKNKFEKIKYDYPDSFDINIYYLNENCCQIIVERLDSNEGWGLELKIKIFDIYNFEEYEIIEFGNSDTNKKSLFFETKINLHIDFDKNILIPKIIYPRKYRLISNKYEVKNIENIDINLIIYKIENNKILIIIRRLDDENGWDNNILINIFDNKFLNRKELINIGPSKNNFKILLMKTKIDIDIEIEYTQQIPKIILQTGTNNSFKNILHFNSIMSFIEFNPDYTYIYFNDTDGRKFLREYFYDEINYAYDILVPGAFKADLLRYCLLHYYGGCYFDCKQILRVPINKFLSPNKTIILCNDVIEEALLNAIICSTKKNIIIEQTIKDCAHNVINKLGKNPLDITGPIFFYKSIKKFIDKDNLILKNNRPINDFHDFSNDYFNNNITLIDNNLIVVNRFYKGYYNKYLNTSHYGKLFENGEIYYKNIQSINNNNYSLKILVYPNKYPDKFSFMIKSLINTNNILNNNDNDNKNNNNFDDFKILYTVIIKRIDSNEGWNFPLKILVIDKNNEELLIDVGISKTNKKEIIFNM
jgi:mannosyltransferase OCH1-like enzyme